MPNKILKEIEEAEAELNNAYVSFCDIHAQCEHCDYNRHRVYRAAKVLQRAREALTWVPVSERKMDKRSTYYGITMIALFNFVTGIGVGILIANC